MMGEADPVPPKGPYLPGAIAEHLTSAAAIFGWSKQTKLTEWIRAGATASSGTVTEPYAIWKKFPSSHIFVIYADGCTVMESFYQSIRCPLQQLIVGVPLAAPWAEPAEVKITGLEDGPYSGTVSCAVNVRTRTKHYFGQTLWLLDGRIVGKGDRFEWDTATVANGVHRLRAVVSRTGLIRTQAFAVKTVDVRN
jgi:hypothetical protein